jgi:hypothetical protein
VRSLKVWPAPAEVEAIAESLRTNRSSNHVRALAQQYDAEESFVEEIAHHVAAGTFTFNESLIFESAPNPKGPTMGNRAVKQLSSTEAEQIIRIFRKNGTTPTVRAGVRQQYNLTESAADAFAQVLNESGTKAPTLTESGPDPRHSRILYEAALVVLDGANRAETDLSTASISDLEAYATLGIARQAFGN